MSRSVSDHYQRPDLLERIEAALADIGASPGTVTPDQLAPIEEFHVGGRMATDAVLDDLGIGQGERALDIGCGTGGTSRHAAARFGCSVEGIDLTESFIETGNVITSWFALGGKVRLHQGSALSLPFGDGAFDLAWMFHVGMNIQAKRDLFAEVFRVLRPGGRFLVYDIMRGEDAATPLAFPVPWASGPHTSFVCPPEQYIGDLNAAGFTITKAEPRRDLADRFFAQLAAQSGEPRPAISLAMIMGEHAREKTGNLKQVYETGRVVPVQILCRKP